MQNPVNELSVDALENYTGGRIHYGIWVLIVAVLTNFACIGLGRFAIGIIIPEMGKGLGMTDTQLGVIVSGTFAGYLASTIASGMLATRFGPRRIIAASMLLVTAGMVVAGSAAGFLVALAGQLLIGIGAGGSNVPAIALVSRWYAEKLRGTASGIVLMGSGLGFALTGLLVPYLLGFYGVIGWRLSWFYLGIIVFVIAVIGVIVFRDNPSEIGVRPIGAIDDPVGLRPTQGFKASQEKYVPQNNPIVDAPTRMGDIYLSKPLRKLGIIYFMFGFSYVIFTTFFAKYLIEEIGFNQASAGNLWFIIGVISIVSGFLWGMLSDRIGRKYALAIAFALQGLCLLVLAGFHHPGPVTAVSVLYALTLWSIPTIMSAACADYVGARFAPAALGMVTIFFGAGQVMSPWLSGYIKDIYHTFTAPFIISALMSLIGALLSVMLPKRA